jgi:phenylacetate-CoA ligase
MYKKIKLDVASHLKEVLRYYNPLPFIYQVQIYLERNGQLRTLFTHILERKHLKNLTSTLVYSNENSFESVDRSDLAKNLDYYKVNRLFVNPLERIKVDGSSSGTTGQPLILRRSLKDLSLEEAFQRYWRSSIGWKNFDKVAVLRGNRFKAFDQGATAKKLWIARRLFLNSYLLTSQNFLFYYNSLKEFNPKVLYCYPTTAISLAKLIENHGLEYLKIPIIVYSSERLLDEDRRLLERVFNSNVYGWYGNGERTSAAGQCGRGNFHFFWNYSKTDFSPEGKIFCTPKRFSSFKVINYDTGDFVSGQLEKGCPCYPLEPAAAEIIGRDSEYLYKLDGTRFSFHLTQVIRDEPSVLHGQLRQDSKGRVFISLEPSQSSEVLQRIEDKFHKRVPHLEVSVTSHDQLSRGATGKLISFKNDFKA